MIFNCIRYWGFSSTDLSSIEYPFIAITPSTTLTWSGITRLILINDQNLSVWKLFVFDRTLSKKLKKIQKQQKKKKKQQQKTKKKNKIKQKQKTQNHEYERTKVI